MAKPVSHDKSLEAKFVLENPIDELAILAAGRAVDLDSVSKSP
jgi:hypothetical protein